MIRLGNMQIMDTFNVILIYPDPAQTVKLTSKVYVLLIRSTCEGQFGLEADWCISAACRPIETAATNTGSPNKHQSRSIASAPKRVILGAGTSAG
jgi:hypothetical protein